MPNDDPFALDLFGNTSLSSGLGLGVTAFGTTIKPLEEHEDDASQEPVSAASQLPGKTTHKERGVNFHLAGDRGLARGWRRRAQDNIAAITLAQTIESEARPATIEEQAALIKFTGFGASDLANTVFRRPGEEAFRKGWQEIGADLQDVTSEQEYASLARCTQYAHFTPEFIVRAIWTGLQRLGWRGGRVLEPGIGTGLFPALMPAELRPVTRKGIEMIGDFRTDALHEALGRAPIEDDTLMALLVLAFAGQNVRVDSANGGEDDYYYGNRRIARHAASLFDAEGKLSFDMKTLRVAVRSMLIEVFSCQENRTNSGIVARAAGDVIGADGFLPNMGTEEFLCCLSRSALEASCEGTSVLPRPRVKDTRGALVEAFNEQKFVQPSAFFAPDRDALAAWLASNTVTEEEEPDGTDAALVIASHPTRGCDVGSIENIHARILEARDNGAAVLIVSSELEEILSLSDRILVMYDGRIAGEFPSHREDIRNIGLAMAGDLR